MESSILRNIFAIFFRELIINELTTKLVESDYAKIDKSLNRTVFFIFIGNIFFG